MTKGAHASGAWTVSALCSWLRPLFRSDRPMRFPRGNRAMFLSARCAAAKRPNDHNRPTKANNFRDEADEINEADVQRVQWTHETGRWGTHPYEVYCPRPGSVRKATMMWSRARFTSSSCRQGRPACRTNDDFLCRHRGPSTLSQRRCAPEMSHSRALCFNLADTSFRAET
jgi:hypothetical protein